MELGKISNENNIALANINFDFSLFKIEAPVEFQGVGAALSTQRRADAEGGTYHQTARRLGALFDQLLPSAPKLVGAYGQRCSAISQMPSINPKGSKRYGIFEQQVGADGTSIWAAATSGASAVSVHLLACMLARIWTPEQATSVWVEIVKRRQAMIKAENGGVESQHWSSLMASQQTISRKELASWDASARAWLRRADEAMNTQQTRLMLIIKNVNISVNNIGDTYDSVIQAWRISLDTMEKLVKGMPQLVQSGAFLLALSAWHLYPDLNVLREASKMISFKDDLITHGSIITIGLEHRNSEPDSGVRWSLPLAYLRYYGEPVQSSGALCQATERVSPTDFVQVVLGCILGGWGFSSPAAAVQPLRVLSQIWLFMLRKRTQLDREYSSIISEIQELDARIAGSQATVDARERELEQAHQNWNKSLFGTGKINAEIKRNALRNIQQSSETLEILQQNAQEIRHVLSRLDDIIDGAPSWPKLILLAAETYRVSKGTTRKQYSMLQRLGMRSPHFLGPNTSQPFFGIDQYISLSSLCKNQETRISLLRKLASCLQFSDCLIIKYSLNDRENNAWMLNIHKMCGLSTAVQSKKRNSEGNIVDSEVFRRWMAFTKRDTSLDAMDAFDLQQEWAERANMESEDNYCTEIQRISIQNNFKFQSDKDDYGGFTWFEPPPLNGQQSDETRTKLVTDSTYGFQHGEARFSGTCTVIPKQPLCIFVGTQWRRLRLLTKLGSRESKLRLNLTASILPNF